VLYFAGVQANLLAAGLALACLILGFVVSYSKARAEGLGMTANVGIAERADRLLAVLLATFLVGLGVSVVLLIVVLGLLAVASLVTVVQRMLAVRRQVPARGGQHTPGVSTP
jgi:CDP-diacylglycerol---glycerol-3-phosphate 3-phosphatidyltransferase